MQRFAARAVRLSILSPDDVVLDHGFYDRVILVGLYKKSTTAEKNSIQSKRL